MPESKKRKLTLTVDGEVVEKAREIGLNLSDITEKVLRGFAFSPTEGEKAEVYGKYKELFATMRELQREYDIYVPIGEDFFEQGGERVPIFQFLLEPSGKFSTDEGEEIGELEKIPLACLYEPKKILANFIKALSDAKQKWKERTEELEMARRIILAVTETLAPKGSKDTKS